LDPPNVQVHGEGLRGLRQVTGLFPVPKMRILASHGVLTVHIFSL
jgi:hypothetical protein